MDYLDDGEHREYDEWFQYFITDRPYTLQTGSLSGDDVDSYTISVDDITGAEVGGTLYVSLISDNYRSGENSWISTNTRFGQFDAGGNPVLDETGNPVGVDGHWNPAERALQIQFDQTGLAHFKVTGSSNGGFEVGYNHEQVGDYTIVYSLAPLVRSGKYISVDGINDAPVVESLQLGVGIQPADLGIVEFNVQSLVEGHVSDVDSNSLQGVAITSMMDLGFIEFNTGTGWQPVDTAGLGPEMALLLRPEDQLRYTQDPNNSVTPTIAFHAWDQTGDTGGLEGTYYDTSGLLGTIHPFSSDEAVASLEVGTDAILSISDTRVSEDDGVAYVTIERTGITGSQVWVRYDTYEKNARLSSDYNDYKPAHGWLTFQQGETSKLIEIPIIDDAVDEGLQRFQVRLAWASDGAILAEGADKATVYITDNDELYAEQSTLILGTNGNDTLQGALQTRLFWDGMGTIH